MLRRKKRAASESPIATKDFAKVKKFVAEAPRFVHYLRDLVSTKFAWSGGNYVDAVTYLRAAASEAKKWAGAGIDDDLTSFLNEFVEGAAGWAEDLSDRTGSLHEDFAQISAGLVRIAGFYEAFARQLAELVGDVERADDQAQWLVEKAEETSKKLEQDPPTKAALKEAISEMQETLRDYQREYASLLSRLGKAEKVLSNFESAITGVDLSASANLPDEKLEGLVDEVADKIGEDAAALEGVFEVLSDNLRGFIEDFDKDHFSFRLSDYETSDGGKTASTGDRVRRYDGAQRVAQAFARKL